LQIVGEELCEALDLRAGQTVLDVAAGNGNASLAAARRWCDVVATDYVPSLLERARERAEAERLGLTFREADAEALPFDGESLDVVVLHARPRSSSERVWSRAGVACPLCVSGPRLWSC
jgi:ubiquinone/menaquinone biosynthesis C-methylase UbiE